jgi:lipopolysaccharide transport system permease protein
MTAAPAPVHAFEEQVIRATRGWASFNLGELWRYRELLFFFAWRQVLVRYKQTVLGVAWAILQPFFLMVVFTIFFGRLANLSTSGIPQPLFYYSALVPWFLFATSLGQGANSLVGNANLLRKIYFPRLVLPASAVIAAIIDFVIALTVLVAMMAFYGYYPRLDAVYALPGAVLLAVVTALGASTFLSALNVAYRDVAYVLGFLTQGWMFATPALYLGGDALDEPWRTLVGLNPMNGVVETFRWALLGAGEAPGRMVAASAAVSVVLLVVGTAYFRRQERTFADVV